MNISKKNEGFSLIELLTVIAISVVLIAIILPNTFHHINSARVQSYRVNARHIYEASVHAIAINPDYNNCSVEECETKIKNYITDHNSLDGDNLDVSDSNIVINYDNASKNLWVRYYGITYPPSSVENPEEESIYN